MGYFQGYFQPYFTVGSAGLVGLQGTFRVGKSTFSLSNLAGTFSLSSLIL